MASTVSLIFFDTRRAVVDAWGASLADTDSVAFSIKDHNTELSQFDCDAIVMLAAAAHEQYGGTPVMGRSQVLDRFAGGKTNGKPQWVVTTVPFPARLSLLAGNDGSLAWQVVPDLEMESGRETYLLFRGILRAIEDFNELYGPKIKKVKVDLDTIGMTIDRVYEESMSARRAIYEHHEIAFIESSGGFDREAGLSYDSFPHPLLDSSTADRGLVLHYSGTPGDFESYGLYRGPLGDIRSIYVTSNARFKLRRFGIRLGIVVDMLIFGKLQEPYSYEFEGNQSIRATAQLQDKRFVWAIAFVNFDRRRMSVKDVGISAQNTG